MKKNMKTIGAGMMIFFLFVGCCFSAEQKCPYIISGDVKIADGTTQYKFAGCLLNFYNASEKEVAEYTVVFYIYDNDGNPPFIGTNCIQVNCADKTAPNGQSEHEVSLDNYLSEIPDDPYQIDFLYVSHIGYSDGSEWNDPYGMYAL